MSPQEPDEPTNEPTPEPAPGGARRWPLLLVSVVAVLLLAGLVVQTLQLRDRDANDDDRDEARAAAGALAEAILSYDYQDIDAALEKVEQYISGDFREVYSETFRTVQVPVITQLQAVATAEVSHVYLTDIDDDAASAVVVVDQTVQSTAGTRSLTGTYLQMDLVKRDGRWVVEHIPLRVSSENETLTPNAEPTTTTTTATPPPP